MFDWSIAAGATLVIIGSANGRGLDALLLGNPVVFFFGEISYALYLTHGIVHVVFEHYFPRIPLYVVAIFAIMLATPVYYLFERPARKLLRSLAFPNDTPEMALRSITDKDPPLVGAASQER